MIFSHLRWIPTPINFLIEFGRITRTIFFKIGGATAPSCPPCRRHCKWVPGGNTGEIKAARKGTGYPTSQSRWLSTSVSLTGTPQRTDCIWDIPLPLPFYSFLIVCFYNMLSYKKIGFTSKIYYGNALFILALGLKQSQ